MRALSDATGAVLSLPFVKFQCTSAARTSPWQRASAKDRRASSGVRDTIVLYMCACGSMMMGTVGVGGWLQRCALLVFSVGAGAVSAAALLVLLLLPGLMMMSALLVRRPAYRRHHRPRARAKVGVTPEHRQRQRETSSPFARPI